MDDQITLFHAVFSRLIESFAPHVHQALSDFEDRLASSPNTSATIILENVFESFPRDVPQYKDILNKLTQVAGCNATLIINDLVMIYKNILNQKHTSPFSVLHNLSLVFKQDNPHQKTFIFWFSLYLSTDLICYMLTNYKITEYLNEIVKIGYKICEIDTEYKNMSIKLLDQWAVIFSLISETDFNGVISQFQQYTLSSKVNRALRLIKFIRLDLNNETADNFLQGISHLLKQMIRKKTITSNMLTDISYLLSTVKVFSEPIQSIFDTSWTNLNDNNLKYGAIDIITVLFPLIPKMSSKIQAFYEQNIFPLVSQTQYTTKTITWLRRFICGSEVDPTWFCWNWGDRNRVSPLCFVKWNSKPEKKMSEPDSFANIFLKYYFPVADFSVCPVKCSHLIVHIAALDFSFFISSIIPKFIDLPFDDPRFIVLLMTVPLFNSADFIKIAKNVTTEDIHKFNLTLKPKFISALLTIDINTSTLPHSICVESYDSPLKTMMGNADQKIESILEKWKISQFTPLMLERRKSQNTDNFFTLQHQVIFAYHYIFSIDDSKDPDMIFFLLMNSFHHEYQIANTSYEELLSLIKIEDLQIPVIKCILSYLKKPRSPESLYMCINILLNVLQHHPKNIQFDMIHDIEMVIYLGLASPTPATRYLSTKVLNVLNSLSNNRTSLFYLTQNKNLLETIVKERLLSIIPDEQEQEDNIKFNVAVCSHYFDTWLAFLSEISNMLIAVNYTPLLTRINNVLSSYKDSFLTEDAHSPMNISLLILYLASNFNLDTFMNTHQIYISTPFEPFKQREYSIKNVLEIIKQMLLANDEILNKYAFTIIQYSNASLLPALIELLCNVSPEQIPDATHTLAIVTRFSSVTGSFMHELFPFIQKFSDIVKSHIISVKANGPRIIKWTPENEQNLIKHSSLARDYCMILAQVLSNINSQLNDNEWPIVIREIVFRFLINWCFTHSPELEEVRVWAGNAIRAQLHVGSFITDALMFNNKCLTLFSDMEMKGKSVLSFLLYYHVKILLVVFIKACYTQPRAAANLFFESIFMAFDAEHSSFLYQHSGSLLLLGQVYQRLEHPRAEAFLMALIDLISHNKRISDEQTKELYKDIPKHFSYATQEVFSSGFATLRNPVLHIPMKEIIDVLKKWIPNIRLLPKLSNCVPGTPSKNALYTPYEFMTKLMQTTEAVNEDNFSLMTTLWTELLSCPDHSELVPLFICEWKNANTKQNLFYNLITTDAVNIVKRLSIHCTFAYYFHITMCLEQDFESELWVIPLLTEAFRFANEDIMDSIPTIIHFTFLFADCGTHELLQVLCHQYNIELPDGPLTNDNLIAVIRQFSDKLHQSSDQYLTQWGTEAIKWLIGSMNIKFSLLSLIIFNQLLHPIEPLVITGVCKAVDFHINNSYDDTKLLQLVGEAIMFYTRLFDENPTFSYSFACAFLDCKIFVDTCLADAAGLFIKALSSDATKDEAWKQIISIIRPLINKIETDEQSQKFFELLIKKCGIDELKMIVAPINDCHPNLFVNSTPADELLKVVSETNMCKALVHYATMTESASANLLNSIFKISAEIVKRIVNENNRNPLAKIYKVALNHFQNCPNAIEFIAIVAKRDPSIATKSIYEFCDWDKNLNDVSRSLNRLLDDDDHKFNTLTDCSTIQSIYNILSADSMPKILPFASQREMIEGMKRTRSFTSHKKRSLSLSRGVSRPPSNIKDTMAIPKRIPNQFIEVSMPEVEFQPLTTPVNLMSNPCLFLSDIKPDLVMNADMFLNNL